MSRRARARAGLRRLRERAAAEVRARRTGRGGGEPEPERTEGEPELPDFDFSLAGDEPESGPPAGPVSPGALGRPGAQKTPRLGDLGRSRGDALRARAGDGGQRLRSAWRRLPLGLRQRLLAGTALAAIVAFGALVVIPLAPCWAPGGEECTPDDQAMALAPADVLAYAHADLDSGDEAFEQAAKLGDRLPLLGAEVLGVLPAATGRTIDFETDIRPWSGGEAALVVDAVGLEIERLLLFEVSDAEGAAAFARSQLEPTATTSETDGVEISVDGRGSAWAIDAGFLLLGPETSVRRSLGLDEATSLAAAPTLERLRDELPDERFAELYISPELAARASADRALRPFDAFVNQAATEGAVASVGLREEGIELAVRSAIDPGLSAARPGVFAALPGFDPQLPEAVGEDALAYLGLGAPGESAAALIAGAAGAAPDSLLGGIRRVADRLERREGVDLERELLPLLSGEVALTVEPPTGGEQDDDPAQTPGLAPVPGTPYLALLAEGVDDGRALETLARLQAPLAASIESGGGTPPLFEAREIAGVDAFGLRLSPIVELTYAAFDDRLVIGTSPLAIERARAVDEPLAAGESFGQVTDGLGEDPSLFAYLDLRDLITLGERIGLATDPAYAQRAPDLRALEAAALSVSRSDTLLSTDLRIAVGEPLEPDPEPPVLEVEPG